MFKKLLTLSLLATTLIAPQAFAQNGAYVEFLGTCTAPDYRITLFGEADHPEMGMAVFETSTDDDGKPVEGPLQLGMAVTGTLDLDGSKPEFFVSKTDRLQVSIGDRLRVSGADDEGHWSVALDIPIRCELLQGSVGVHN
jgi:hypothetical protein